MLIDTHAHVNFRSFKDDAKETLQRALDNDTWVINVGSQIDTSRQAVELASEFKEGVYAVIGLHPEHTHSQYVDEEETFFKSRQEYFDTSMYESLVKNKKVVGIGECGLDYYYITRKLEHGAEEIRQIKEKQIEAFRKQIRFAKEHDKVLVVHSRPEKGNDELYKDMFRIFEEEKVGEMRFEIHSYTHSPEYFQKFLDLGAYVSFNGIITFDKTGNMEQLVKLAPLDKILLETDCPYLSPVPMRGKRNEPVYVKHVAQKAAEIKNLSIDEMAKITTENAKKLFRI